MVMYFLSYFDKKELKSHPSQKTGSLSKYDKKDRMVVE